MALLAPWFLVGAAAVGLPLYLHLLQRENPIRLPFSSLMLFEKRKETSFLERRFRYLLLLALRLALLILAAMAFAKPIWERAPTTALNNLPALHLVFLDRSLSMGHADRWERATAEARSIVESLEAGDQAQIVATGPAVDVVTRPSADTGDLLSAIESLRPGNSRNSYSDVVEAVRSLTPRSGTRVEAHLISDFQSSAMPGRFSDLVLPPMAQLDVRNVAGPDDANWAIESVKGSLRLSGEDKPRLEVTVAGFAPDPARKTVALEIEGETIASESKEIPAMGRASFLFEDFQAPVGMSRARVALSPEDELPADDRRFVVLDNSEPAPILFITADRNRRDALYFEAALSASTSAKFSLETRSAGEAAGLSPNAYALVILSDASPSAGLQNRLREYVESGGGLFIAVGPQLAERGSVPVTRNRTASGRIGERPGDDFQIAGSVAPAHPVLGAVDGFRNAKFFWHARLAPAAEDDVVAELADGAPLVLERAIGSGRVLVFGSSLDNVRNDLPIRPVFVPFVVESARYLSGFSEETRQAIVDSTYELRRRRREAASMVQVLDPKGERALSLSESVSRTEVVLDQLGFYEVRAPGEIEFVAVNLDPRESNLRQMDRDTLELWQSTGRGSPEAAAAASGEAVQIQPPPIPIWKWLLLLLVAVVLLESVVGNRLLNVKRGV